MELKLEVVLSSSIKRKKPWPRFCWLGQEKEAVFLLDDKRISEINMVTGRTKKKTPKLHPLLNNVVTMAASQTSTWLAGLLISGELFLWNRDKDWLKTAPTVPEVARLIASVKGHGPRVSLHVSGDGMRVVLSAVTGHLYLWECADVRDLTAVRDGPLRGRWAHIQPSQEAALPSLKDKEASQQGIFVQNEAVGDVFLSAWVFTSGDKLSITFLKVQWEEVIAREAGCVDYSVKWATKTYPLPGLTPPCRPVKSRGALVPALSPDGRLLAVALNQKDPRATQVLFVSTQNFVSVARGLGGCGSKNLTIPSKYLRSYWVGGVSWSPTGLFLACVLKRGSLLMLPRLGGLLSLATSGCNVDFGPAHFLPLHPLVTYRPPESCGRADASLSSSSASFWDVLRQRFSVTWHPRLCYLLVSDGYMVTVLRLMETASPARLISALLQQAGRDLENTVHRLEKTQSNIRSWLDSVSSLSSQEEETDPSAPSGPNTPHLKAPSLPLFLQDQGTMSDTRELLHRAQAFFEDDSDVDARAVAGSHAADGGVLEFASMFDTLHARPGDPEQDSRNAAWDASSAPGSERKRTSWALRALAGVKGHLLTAWALGLSVGGGGGGGAEEQRYLLTHNVRCVLRLAALLHYTTSTAVGASDICCVSQLFGAFLVFLSWDALHAGGQSRLGLVVDLTGQLARLLLAPLPDALLRGRPASRLSSRSISGALLLVKQAADALDGAYTLQQRRVWASAPQGSGEDPPTELWSSDVYRVPLLQDPDHGRTGLTGRAAPPAPHRPSSRLLGAWRWLYGVAQRYTDALRGHAGRDGWAEEQQRAAVLLSRIQEALQGTGERLEADGPGLLPCQGERHFLFGSYSESADAWRAEMWTERNISSDRGVFQQTRLCLALLYGLLFQYRLREAQALGDHMARLVLDPATPRPQSSDPTQGEEARCESWLPVDLHRDAARAVVQTLGRFMASYFTNQPLCILPPHSVDLLPPLHLPHAPPPGRPVPLCQETVARAVREQHVSDVWTVDYAQDLLLVGGLLPEAAWLAHRLGDWKTSAALSLAYTSHRDQLPPGLVKLRELHFPAALEPESIFQDQLHSLLGRNAGSNEAEGASSLSEGSDGEDWDALRGALQDVLKASVMAGVDVVSGLLSDLTESAKALASGLPALVPPELYLPAPPLYCPQPAPNTQDPVGTWGRLTEVCSRYRVSAELQRLLLVLRSARCCRPAAQWYVSRLRRARHLQHKIKKKYGHPCAAEVEAPFPEGLVKLVTRGGFFWKGPSREGQLDPVTVQTISCFRDLCALCWLLHVRDQLSVSCRKYQAARHAERDAQDLEDGEMISSCVEAVRWACRLLPFSHFLNAEEILQDLLLSLVSELPPLSVVADALVLAFPAEEDSVRVPLREKYHALLERLKHCTVLGDAEGPSGDVIMTVALQDKRRQRRKDLQRLGRHLAPPQLHLWQREAEEDPRGAGGAGGGGGAEGGRLSLGASLSTSTLTDRGQPMVYSDGDTSEALSTDLPSRTSGRPLANSKHVQEGTKTKKVPSKVKKALQVERQGGPSKQPQGPPGDPEGPALPAVGTWEFELEDREYPRFLELFLSYVLERDGSGAPGEEDAGGELPLLRGFTPALRERELHSLTFDVLSTLRRRQRDGGPAGRRQPGAGPDAAPVFRAGSCYRSQAGPEAARSEPPSSLGWGRTPEKLVSAPGSRQGLFGLQQRRSTPAPEWSTVGGSTMGGSVRATAPSPSQSSVPWESLSQSCALGTPVPTETLVDLQQGLDSTLEARFPELGRLLEWMVRWANRRTPHGTHGTMMKTKKKTTGPEAGGASDGGGVVIRVKASTPAVLTALGLLQRRCSVAPARVEPSTGPSTGPTGTRVAEPHTGPAQGPTPATPPEAGRDQEGEGSVDTGYPGSAHTPVTLPDAQLMSGHASFGSEEETERGSSRNTPDRPSQDPVPYDSEMGTMTSQHPSVCGHAAPEEPSSGSEDTSALSVLSVDHVCGNVQSLDTVLKLEDLRCSERVGDVSSGASQGPSITPGPETPREPEPPREAGPPAVPAAQGAQDGPDPPLPPSSRAAPLTHHAQDPPPQHLQPPQPPQPPLPPESSGISVPPPVATVTNATPAPGAEPVRQLVNDELFRLVQLQQINFMSLMHMVGSTFSSLPYVQLAQSSTLMPPPAAQPAALQTPLPAPLLPPVHATVSGPPPPQSTAPLGVERCEALPILTSTYKTSARPHPDASQSGPPDQPSASRALPPYLDRTEVMSVQTPGRTPGETAVGRAAPLPSDPNTPHPVTPSLLPPGLKLIRLPPPPGPPVPQAWGPRAQTGGPDHAEPDAREDEVEEEEEGEDEEVWFAPPSQRHGLHSTPGSARRRTRASGPYCRTPQRSEVPSLPHPEPPARGAPPGLRLLSCQPLPEPAPTAFPQPVSRMSTHRPFTSLIPALSGPPPPPPTIQLLHLDPEPTTMFPPSSPAPHINYVDLLQDLRRLDTGRASAGTPGLQLILVNPEPETQAGSTPSCRTRSRKDRAKTAEKVTFRPDESIIPTQEPGDGRVHEESAVGRDLTRASADPPGPHEPLLTGQRLLDQAVATSAELHAYASTHKSAPESHDACTNTDPAGPSKLVDKAVSAIASDPDAPRPVEVFPPELLMSPWLPRETPVRDPEETHRRPQQDQDSSGRRFLNVVDLDDEESLLRDLPRGSRQDPQHPAPSTAQLHLIAASIVSDTASVAVSNAASVAVSDAASATVGNAVAEPRTSPLPAGEIPEPVAQPDLSTGDPVTDALFQGRPSNTSRAPDPHSPGPLGASTGPQAAHFSSCLSEMDAQLAALQSIADNMETEFVNTRMLVRTIETSSPVSAQEPDGKSTRSKTVSLFIPDKVRRSPGRANKENVLAGRPPGIQDSQTDAAVAKRQSVSLSPLSPNTQGAPLSSPRTPTRTKDHAFPETTGMSVDSSLGLSGLSDVTDILGELVREGALSPSDLDVSHSQAARLHRLQHHQQQQRADWSLRSREADARDSRKELRVWMRRKQRDRLASYQRQREELRQREHRPFTSAKPLNSTFTCQAAEKKIKEDKEKVVLLEQYRQRTREACLLVSDLPPATLTVPSAAAQTGSAPSPPSMHPPAARISSSSNTRNLSSQVQSRPSQPLLHPWEQSEKQRWRSSLENQQRFGLHRPVSALPKDLLSQVTRRGMISEARGGATPHGPANQGRAPHRGALVRSGVNRSSSRADFAGRREEVEREEVQPSSSWNPPPEISRLLDVKQPNPGVTGLSEDEEEAEDEGAAAMSWLDKLSDTDTSNLSRIDWAEIERLVATEDI